MPNSEIIRNFALFNYLFLRDLDAYQIKHPPESSRPESLARTDGVKHIEWLYQTLTVNELRQQTPSGIRDL